MQNIQHYRKFIFLLIFSLLTLINCKNDDDTTSCFPNQNIQVRINLNLPAYQPLQNIGGWVYINEQQSGNRGLIVVNTNNGYLAFDRNAPHICPTNNSTLTVKNDIKILCPEDQAEWILISGEPISVAKVSPKRYFTSYSNNILDIYN